MTEQPRSDELNEPSSNDAITLELPREEVEALLLAVDALQPLLDRIRAQIAPVPAAEPGTVTHAPTAEGRAAPSSPGGAAGRSDRGCPCRRRRCATRDPAGPAVPGGGAADRRRAQDHA